MPDMIIVVIALSFLAGWLAGWIVRRLLAESTAETLESALHRSLTRSVNQDGLDEEQAQNIYDWWMEASGLHPVRGHGPVIKCGCGFLELNSIADRWLDEDTNVLHTSKWCDTVSSSR